jgi:hypothetical protein
VYDVTVTGIPTGPLTVGPIIAAPIAGGCSAINVVSISLDKTPGDNKISAMLFV